MSIHVLRTWHSFFFGGGAGHCDGGRIATTYDRQPPIAHILNNDARYGI
jgi:hypothetical protein